MGVGFCITGINVDNIYGTLREGFILKINLHTTKGETRLYLKNGCEVWTHIDLKIIFDGHYEGDYKLFSF